MKSWSVLIKQIESSKDDIRDPYFVPRVDLGKNILRDHFSTNYFIPGKTHNRKKALPGCEAAKKANIVLVAGTDRD